MGEGQPAAAGGGGSGAPRRVRAKVVRDALLVLLTVASGAVDAVSFLELGRVFTANMTGNLIVLGVSAAQDAPAALTEPATALGGFLAGALVVRQTVRPAARSGLWPFGTRAALGGVLALESGVCAMWAVTGGHPQPHVQLTLIAGLGAAMGAQTAAIRGLSVSGVTTTFVTGTLADLALGRGPKARRVAVVIGLTAGAAAAALLLRVARPWALVPAPVLVALVLAAAWVQSRRRRRAASGRRP